MQIGNLRLKDIWLIPSFKATKLISVLILTHEGFSIIFNVNQAIGKYRTNRKAVFKAITQNNLYILREAQEVLTTVEGTTNITETDAEL